MRELKYMLEKYDGTQSMISDCLELVSSKEKIVVFGAGVGGGETFQIAGTAFIRRKNNCLYR